MKKLFLLLTLMMTFITNVYSQEFLTNTEKKKILSEIDSFCGDTWCEGDFNYEFHDFECNFSKNTCELNYSFYPYGEEESAESAICILNGVNSVNQILDFRNIVRADGTSYSYTRLNFDFYLRLTDECISLN